MQLKCLCTDFEKKIWGFLELIFTVVCLFFPGFLCNSITHCSADGKPAPRPGPRSFHIQWSDGRTGCVPDDGSRKTFGILVPATSQVLDYGDALRAPYNGPGRVRLHMQQLQSQHGDTLSLQHLWRKFVEVLLTNLIIFLSFFSTKTEFNSRWRGCQIQQLFSSPNWFGQEGHLITKNLFQHSHRQLPDSV